MLWKKESGQPDALYIDIFTPNTQHWDSILNSLLQTIEQTPHPEKSDAIALKQRNLGNAFFRRSKPFDAMESYGDSLRFAYPGSEHISLAYANRAACFLSLKMYDECLIDIEYALAAGYPEHLRPKLKDRKVRCLKEMQESPLHPREKTSIEPNEKFPFLSNVAMVQQYGDKGNQSVVAKTDIDVGQVIAVEDAYQACVMDRFGMFCNICSKEVCNLVPCMKCTAMFCPECQGHFLHEYECGLSMCGKSTYNSNVMRLVRGILLALNMFKTADELMSFVEKMLKKPTELPESLLADRSKYHAYFNSPIKLNFESLDKITSQIYSTYKTLLRIPRVNEMFKATKHRRFLMHLIGHHMTVPELGAGTRVSLVMMSYMKHSCYPNVNFGMRGGKWNWFSVKPIKKGEQLFVSCAPYGMNSTKERKEYLWNVLKIKCDCSRCNGEIASPALRQQLVSDPAYRYIDANVKSLKPLAFATENSKPLMEACEAVLRKYGEMDWCDEIILATKLYEILFKVRLMGGGSDFEQPLVQECLSHCDG